MRDPEWLAAQAEKCLDNADYAQDKHCSTEALFMVNKASAYAQLATAAILAKQNPAYIVEA